MVGACMRHDTVGLALGDGIGARTDGVGGESGLSEVGGESGVRELPGVAGKAPNVFTPYLNLPLLEFVELVQLLRRFPPSRFLFLYIYYSLCYLIFGPLIAVVV